jgi:hypothetical protein
MALPHFAIGVSKRSEVWMIMWQHVVTVLLKPHFKVQMDKD